MGMKILIVSEDLPHRSMGGLGRHAVTLAWSLFRAGHEVDFMGNNLVPFDEMQSDITLPGEFFPELNLNNSGWKELKMGIYNPLKRPFIAWRFARAIMQRARNYDVVHYHGHFPLLANFIPRDINFVQTRHDQGSDCLPHIRFRNHDVCRETSVLSCAACATLHPNLMQKSITACTVWLYRKLVARSFLRHKTIFVSDMLRSNFSRTAGHKKWGCVIHNFLDREVFRPGSSANNARSGMTEVFIAGKLYEPKGIAAFLEVISTRVPQKMHITVAGDGSNENQLRERYGSDCVSLVGWQCHADTMRLMGEADIVVVPSLVEEAFGFVTLEGLVHGKPVLALDRGATPELSIYQRFPGQLTLYATMNDLVDGLCSLCLKDMDPPVLNEASATDISIVLNEIIKVYSADATQWQALCH